MFEHSLPINNKIKYPKFLLFLFIIITFTSVNEWSSLPILNSQIERCIQFVSLFLTCTFIIKYKSFNSNYKIIKYYLIWAIIGIIRGLFIADCYWEYNQLTIGIMSLSLPLLVFIFDEPSFVLQFKKTWLKYCIPTFIVFFYWTVGATQFYLSPLFLLGCFIPLMPFKWKIIIIILLLMMGIELSNRSQFVKVAISFMIAFAFYYHKYIPLKLIKFSHCFLYVAPIVFLFLGITGKFNIFKDSFSEDSKGKYESVQSDGNVEDITQDNRTFIYLEVINSAIKHNYYLYGRSPARGNDSFYFYDIGIANNKDYKKKERFMNEMCHTNIFTWLGLIGIFLYSYIYLKSSYLAVYKSNSYAMKMIGCLIAFHWAFGWIEDMNRYDISNISLWIIIAMGFSIKFRTMSDSDFSIWFKSIFK